MDQSKRKIKFLLDFSCEIEKLISEKISSVYLDEEDGVMKSLWNTNRLLNKKVNDSLIELSETI